MVGDLNIFSEATFSVIDCAVQILIRRKRRPEKIFLTLGGAPRVLTRLLGRAERCKEAFPETGSALPAIDS